MARREGLQRRAFGGGVEALIPLAALINSSVELIAQPDAHDIVCELRVRRHGFPRH
jgi:hypothetical protein